MVKMRPDFFVIIDGNYFAIEYDGTQHFREVKSWHQTDEEFKRRHTSDINKNRFFEDNNIPFFTYPLLPRRRNRDNTR